MMILKREKLLLKLVLFVFIAVLAIAGTAMPSGCLAGSKVVVVASTSWTGAIAQAAGADEVRVLAPLELKHPPEYDYRPADIARLSEATAVVYAGYEPFMKKLLEAAGYPEPKIIKVTTANTPDNLKEQARLLAEKLGTQKKEAEWEIRFDKVTAEILKKAEAKNAGKTKVLVQQHQQPFVKWLGFEIAGVFSAGELTPAKVMEYANLKPDLVIDNFHNPQGKPIVEVAKCKYVELINFPSAKAPTLIDLFKENAGRLGL
ncbi:MAG: metal ABC transporter substrate-binding protein [Firmicutes bacterium]|nr:metal ABC transporter substrate-binding protein [Bacillota bacterium]